MESINTISLLKATVGHKRLSPKINRFAYHLFYVIVPVLKDPDYKLPKLFSFNRWNILSLYTKDHFNTVHHSDWYTFISEELKKTNIYFDDQQNKIYLIALPRVFGFVFNPISYWLIVDENNLLRAVLCEVRSTFEQTHNYLLSNPDGSPITEQDVLVADKNLYVSPFNPREGYYEFQFTYSKDTFKSVINYFDKSERHILNTYVGGMKTTLTSFKIIAAILQYPAMTLIVVLRIHMQALKLLLKGVKPTLHEKPHNYTNNQTSVTKKTKKVSLKSA